MLCEARAVADTKEALPLLGAVEMSWNLKRGKPSQNLAVALTKNKSTTCWLGLANEPTYEFNMRLDRVVGGGFGAANQLR